MKFEIEGQEAIIDSYSNDTQEWKEAQMNSGALKGELCGKLGAELVSNG